MMNGKQEQFGGRVPAGIIHAGNTPGVKWECHFSYLSRIYIVACQAHPALVEIGPEFVPFLFLVAR